MMSEEYKLSNGHRINKAKLDLFLEEEWPIHRRESTDALRKINEMHLAIGAIREDTKHLTKLDSIAETLRSIRDSLVEVVAGKNVVDSATVKEIMNAQQSSYTAIIGLICKVFGLVVILLVGLKFAAPAWFN